VSGAWELKAARSVLVGILHCENTTMAWAFGLRNLIIPGEVLPVAGRPFCHARNDICQAALHNKFEWVFFLDSDVIPPRDTIIRLISRQQPIISGVYCRRSPPHGIPVYIKNRQWGNGFAPNKLIEVDVVGAGCLLIHRSVLEKMPPIDAARGKRWFDWRVDCPNLPEGEAMSEDFSFCLQARKHGWKVILDTSVMCRHAGNAQAELGSMKPLECNTVT